MTRHVAYEELLAAYALDALEPAEEFEITAHLVSCDECRRELDGLQDAAAHLGELAPVEAPPAALRADLLGAAALDRRAEEPVVAAPVPQRPASEPAAPVSLDERRRRRWHRPLAVAAGVAAIAGFGVWAGTVQSALNDNENELDLAARISAMAADPATRSAYLLDTGGHAHAQAMVNGGDVAVVVSSLEPNDAETTSYVVWAEEADGDLRAVEAFDVAAGETVRLLAELPTDDVRAVAISRERGNALPETPTFAVARGVLATET